MSLMIVLCSLTEIWLGLQTIACTKDATAPLKTKSCRTVLETTHHPPKPKRGKYETNFIGAVFAETEEAGIGVVIKTLEVT